MISSVGMETFECRLASFKIAHASTKIRTSTAKDAGKLKWQHKCPDPAQLARAGFFYNPTASTPDNTTCYLCHSSLDGWEEDDSAIGEHLSFSPDCGWATLARIEQDIDDGNLAQKDPMDESLLNARKMTFGANWPHEDKRGWVCKTQKMSEAGWYYCPTAESEDFVRCCYCNLSLDGWEPKDDPYDEHQRRSPDCMFFALSQSNGKKTARGKKSRASKGARRSAQSKLTTASEDISMIDVHMDMNEDATTSIQEPEPPRSPKAAKSAKKGGKGKKIAPKSKRKASTAQQEDTVPGSSFVEPEDDDFEVKVEQTLNQKPTQQKRKSDQMIVDDDSMQSEPKRDHEMPLIPPTKRRATRSSVSHANKAADLILDNGPNDESLMTDVENMPPSPPPVSKKATKGGKRKASSSARKASTTSTASKASLRATIPDDEEIDAALEADLDRPLTDDEAESDPPTMPKTKSRRLTRTRPGSRNITASTAPVRRATRASALPVEGDSTTNVDIPANDTKEGTVEESKAVEIALTAMDHAKQEIIAETDKHLASQAKTRSRAASKPTEAPKEGKERRKEEHDINESEAVHQEPLGAEQTPEVSKSEQESDRLPGRSARIAHIATRDTQVEQAGDANSSVLGPSMAHEESGNELEDGHPSQDRGKKAGKPRSAAVKRGEAVEKAAVVSQDNETVAHVEAEDAGRKDPVILARLETLDDQENTDEPILPVVASTKEAPKGKGKATKRGRGRPAKAKRSDTNPPSEPHSIPQAEPVEVPSVDAHSHDAVVGLPTPADSQDHDDGHKVSVRSPTPQTQAPSEHQTPKTANSPQSSDAENQPPSARPSALRPPLLVQTPSKTQTARVPLAATTPMASPSKRNISRLQSCLPWTSIDFEKIFTTPSSDQENLLHGAVKEPKQELSSPEKKLTVEEWIQWNAKRGEEQLREDCERLVGRFEGEGVRALKTLEGVICAE